MELLPDWPLEYNTQFAFGLLLFAGVLGGYLAHRISWLPSITGFMAIGILIGPSGTDLLTSDALDLVRAVIDVSLGLILYRLGLTLDLRAMVHDPRLLLTSLVESGVTFITTFGVLVWLGLPSLLAGLAAAIVISSSPAILIHVAHEVGAAGPVTERTKELVALNNLFSFFAFSALLPAGHLAAEADPSTVWLQPLYQLLGFAGSRFRDRHHPGACGPPDTQCQPVPAGADHRRDHAGTGDRRCSRRFRPVRAAGARRDRQDPGT